MWNFNFLNLLTTYLPTLVFKISHWRLFGFLLFFGMLCFEGLAQVYDGTYTVTSQEQIDTFNFTEITGSLLIQNTDITNVDGFSGLERIGGSLSITNNNSLPAINNFTNLNQIGSELRIENNDQLTQITNFNAVDTVGTFFVLANNNNLPAIDGFDDLNYVGWGLYIRNNQNLTSIDGFNNLENVYNRSGNYNYEFRIAENPSLTSIDGFNNLVTVLPYFRIRDNESLQSIGGFGNLNYSRDFQMLRNNNLTSITAFDNFKTVAGSFYIQNNNSLPAINNFTNLNQIGSELRIENNDQLTQITNFNAVDTVGTFFVIANNNNLPAIDEFDNLAYVGWGFYITNNENLTSIDGFNQLTNVYYRAGNYDYEFLIAQNPSLTSINGFDDLVTVLPYFRIRDNESLTSVDGFENLNYTRDFQILRNNSLNSMGRFDSLSEVPGAINIIENTNLCALTGFTALSSIGSVNISQNEILNNCCVLNCFDVSAVTTGSITIDNNAKGCNSLNEVETLCPAEFCATPGCQVYDSSNCGCPADCPNWPQAIFLNTGWNLISFDIVPGDNSIQNVFANIISNSNLEFVSTFSNGTVTFNPNLPTPFNTLQTITEGFGYWVKVTNATFLPVDGLCVDDSFRKPFEAGWNLVAFPPDESQPPADYFADLITNDNLEFVAGFDGGIKTFNPALPAPFQTLQQMENGFGYWVKVTNAVD